MFILIFFYSAETHNSKAICEGILRILVSKCSAPPPPPSQKVLWDVHVPKGIFCQPLLPDPAHEYLELCPRVESFQGAKLTPTSI
jgi:hypothetical protein